MADIADIAVGAILEIPQSALDKIDKAEKAIKQLGETSEKVAKEVSNHWGTIATGGIDTFIQKIAEAKAKMEGLGTINVTLNTNDAVQSTEQLSTATQKTATDVSNAVQTMAQSWTDFADKNSRQGLNLFSNDLNSIQKMEDALKTLKEKRDSLVENERGAAGFQKNTLGFSRQELNDQIAALEQMIKLLRQSNEEKDKANRKATEKNDKEYLAEQKRMLADILDLRKQVNAQKIVVARGQVTDSSNLEQDKKILSELIARLYEAKNKLKDYNAEKYKNVSAEGQAKAQINILNQENALVKEQLSFRNKLNSAIQTGNEYISQAQASKARISNTDEGRTQRQLNSDYKAMIGILKEVGEIKAKAAEQGRGVNQNEIALIQALCQRYAIYKDDINRVSGAFVNLAEARRKAFESDRTEQLARNAIMLADANKKAEGNTKNLVTEYKNLTKRLQEVNDAMNRYQAAGGDTNKLAYGALAGEMMTIMARRKEIEKQDIAEVNQYRAQMEQESARQSLSAFVQYEAQKTAEAKKQADERTRQQAESLNKYLNSAQGAMWYSRQINKGKVDDSYENRERAIKQLENAIRSLNERDKDYEKNLEKLSYTLNILKNRQKEVADVMKPTKPMVSPQDAINAAKNATSLKQLQDAYKQLKEVMSKTDPNLKMWGDMNTQLQQTKTKLDEIKKKMGEFQGQASRTNNVLNQIQGRIAAAFSIGAITGFIKKMTEVRAQFELQRVALGAIIQDRDEANKIFTHVQNMALESPFNIMQLEKATKQIAAFGFETKKLVPTMKMFADISAGLGVEIDRLVLVMGHLKARNFLEGTMVRQFTNMGFNVLGELSKYYSELEDRLVSVGEVQDRVKKKMISFEDVEEVLKRVTSAGGMFYDMQKKQSDSLWGQMQRIHDAYDLMLNEIGQSNEGVLKAALTTIRTLINSWRTLKPYIVSAVTAMTSYMVVAAGWKMISTLITGSQIAVTLFTKGLQAAKTAQQSLNVTMASNPYAAVAASLLALGTYIYQVATATSKLEEEMGRIGSELTDSLNESIATFHKLANVMADTTKTYTERTEAMTEMRRVYADILPKEKLEISYIQSLNGNYAELTKTIQEYYQQKEYNQKVEAIQGSDEAKKVQKQLEETLNQMNKDGVFDMKYSKAMIKSWSDTIAKEINTGKIPATLDALEERIKKVFNAKNLAGYREESYGKADMRDVMQEVEKVQKAYGDITIETANAENALISYQNALKKFDLSQLEESKKSLQEQSDSLRRDIERGYIQKDVNGKDSKFAVAVTLSTEQLESYRERLNQVEAQINAVNEAERNWLTNQYKASVAELNEILFKDVKAYKEATNELRKLEMQGKRNSTEWDTQKKKMDDARESADKTAKTYGTTVNWALIDTAQTSFELRGELNKLASQSFPKVAELALKSLSKLQEYLLRSKNTVYEWVKGLLEWIPESARDAMGLNNILASVDENYKLTQQQLKSLDDATKSISDNSKEAGDSFEKMVSDKAKSRIKEFGGNISDIDRIISDTSKGADAMAKELRSQAKTWEETAKSYQTSTDKTLWLKSRGLTEESVALMEKNAKAAKALATDLAGVDNKTKQGGKGKDEILELWKNRLKALQDFYKRYDELRQHFNMSESLDRDKKAFQGLFDTLGMDMDKIVSMGMDKQGLANNIKDMLNVVRYIRPQLTDEFEKAFADTQIQVDFKIKENEEEKLKKQLDEMFDNYELTKELSKLGVGVDLTYMVGGKPTTLDDIRKEYERLMVDFANKSEEEQKIIKKMGEDLQKKELDERKKRLDSYVKYLANAYSESAKVQLDYYTKLTQMHDVFAKSEKDLREKLASPDISVDEKIRITEILKNLPNQASRASKGMREEMEKELDKLNLDKLLKSPLFSEMFQDLGSMTNNVLDTMLVKIREIQNSANDLSLSQIRQLAQYAEKIENAKIDNSPFKEAYNAIKKAYELRAKGITAKGASDALAVSEQELERLETLKDDISFILGIKEKSYEIDGENVIVGGEQIRLTEQQISLLNKSTGYLNEQLDVLQDQSGALDGSIKNQKQVVTANAQNVQVFKNAKNATEKFGAALQEAAKAGIAATDAIKAGLQVFGKEIGEEDEVWLDFVGNMLSTCITLGIAFVALGVEINSALGIIGIIATALSVVSQLFTAIFQAHDKRLEKQIGKVQDRVDALSKGFERLQKSIERAFTIGDENRLTEQALRNLEEQKKGYQEMIALEESKKKTDYDKIKEYKDKLQELAEAEKELYEKKHEKYGSTNDPWDEANNFVDAWLDAYKENGDGLDVLGDKWDEFYENLVKKQATSKIVGDRMNKYIQEINNAIDKNMNEYGYVDMFKDIGERFKKEFGSLNHQLIDFFNYAGITGGNGELILSDLQKGIQNITEPQAAAIEAYLNSMRFAVFRHTEQLDTLIQTIQMQYGSGAENPVVTELKGIRGVLDSIDRRLGSVINTQGRNATLRIGT